MGAVRCRGATAAGCVPLWDAARSVSFGSAFSLAQEDEEDEDAEAAEAEAEAKSREIKKKVGGVLPLP